LEDESSDDLGNVKVPTLIIWGDQDRFIPRNDQEKLAAAIPNSRLAVYQGVGHAVYWEEPERVAADLTTFIQDLTS
jgi:pimeloyl-ACP methyl ester carboxylesterase